MATAKAKLKVREFTNEPLSDFSNAANRKKMEAALKKVAGELGREYPMWIGGKKVITAGKRKSTNPSRPVAGRRGIPGCVEGARDRGD